jgi:hypothetical protein
MPDLKPCIRCGGTGRVPIEALGPDPHVHTVIGTAKCHGCGGEGRVPVCEPPEVERILFGDPDAKPPQGVIVCNEPAKEPAR